MEILQNLSKKLCKNVWQQWLKQHFHRENCKARKNKNKSRERKKHADANLWNFTWIFYGEKYDSFLNFIKFLPTNLQKNIQKFVRLHKKCEEKITFSKFDLFLVHTLIKHTRRVMLAMNMQMITQMNLTPWWITKWTVFMSLRTSSAVWHFKWISTDSCFLVKCC